jgi:hypothetical protein
MDRRCAGIPPRTVRNLETLLAYNGVSPLEFKLVVKPFEDRFDPALSRYRRRRHILAGKRLLVSALERRPVPLRIGICSLNFVSEPPRAQAEVARTLTGDSRIALRDFIEQIIRKQTPFDCDRNVTHLLLGLAGTMT